jgi:hypothetical protein
MRRPFAFILLLILASPACVFAYTTPKQIKETVTFIFSRNSREQAVPRGTGFFVGVRDERKRTTFYTYLVTAKHVALNAKNQLLDSLYIRMNAGDGSQFQEVPLVQGGKSCFFTHTDPSVDLIVIPVAVDTGKFQVKFLPDSMLATKKIFSSEEITEGDDVFFVGLFTPHAGAKKNYPMVRFGKVAMIPEEKVIFTDRGTELYLVEGETCAGQSGSPVFLYLNPARNLGKYMLGTRYYLAGILQGGFWDAGKFDFSGESRVDLTNSGISAVVPAYKLSEILFSDEMRAHRRELKG